MEYLEVGSQHQVSYSQRTELSSLRELFKDESFSYSQLKGKNRVAKYLEVGGKYQVSHLQLTEPPSLRELFKVESFSYSLLREKNLSAKYLEVGSQSTTHKIPEK